jgi:ABC-type Mn2+/Zn2+ transport system permease subunit
VEALAVMARFGRFLVNVFCGAAVGGIAGYFILWRRLVCVWDAAWAGAIVGAIVSLVFNVRSLYQR